MALISLLHLKKLNLKPPKNFYGDEHHSIIHGYKSPDPLSRACWDNYLTISSKTAQEIGVKNWNISNGALNGSLVNITMGNKTLEKVPVMIQPGQAHGTVSLAVGYGRTMAGKCGNNIGHNAYPFVDGGKVDIELVEGSHEFAAVQLHHTMMGREIVKETTLADFINDLVREIIEKNITLMMVLKLLRKLLYGMITITRLVTSGICLLI